MVALIGSFRCGTHPTVAGRVRGDQNSIRRHYRNRINLDWQLSRAASSIENSYRSATRRLSPPEIALTEPRTPGTSGGHPNIELGVASPLEND